MVKNFTLTCKHYMNWSPLYGNINVKVFTSVMKRKGERPQP